MKTTIYPSWTTPLSFLLPRGGEGGRRPDEGVTGILNTKNNSRWMHNAINPHPPHWSVATRDRGDLSRSRERWQIITNLTKANRANRLGITIIEVLTSIVVAMIGVFGVMILIPFAVQQAQIGLDLDDATAMADNAIATFEINQYHRVNDQGELPWIDAPFPFSVDN